MASFLSGINVQAILLALGAAVFTHSVSFRVGSKTVSIVQTEGVPPVHFTYQQAELAAVAVLSGQTGTITICDIQVVVQ